MQRCPGTYESVLLAQLVGARLGNHPGDQLRQQQHLVEHRLDVATAQRGRTFHTTEQQQQQQHFHKPSALRRPWNRLVSSHNNNNSNSLRQQQFSRVVMGNDSCRSSTVYNSSATPGHRLLRP
uniref:(northern house mosquito) hypothetical protein n=1 Tax=Culex pipiens TaxID=7175 RepID=A0A8D8FMZ7_CULPI